jgi:hypothetical protein
LFASVRIVKNLKVSGNAEPLTKFAAAIKQTPLAETALAVQPFAISG